MDLDQDVNKTYEWKPVFIPLHNSWLLAVDDLFFNQRKIVLTKEKNPVFWRPIRYKYVPSKRHVSPLLESISVSPLQLWVISYSNAELYRGRTSIWSSWEKCGHAFRTASGLCIWCTLAVSEAEDQLEKKCWVCQKPPPVFHSLQRSDKSHPSHEWSHPGESAVHRKTVSWFSIHENNYSLYFNFLRIFLSGKAHSSRRQFFL